MILKSCHFDERFEKIAQSILEFETGSYFRDRSYSSSKNSSTDSFGFDGTDTPDISDTISKVRENADLQPLHKDKKQLKDIPRDVPHAITMGKKQTHLGRLVDRRLVDHKLKKPF